MANLVYCIQNAVLIDSNSPFHHMTPHIYFDQNQIIHVGEALPIEATIIDGTGQFVSAGWIDLHTHVFSQSIIGLPIDVAGVKQGVSMVVDAGSSGSRNIAAFAEEIKQAATRVKVFINLAATGLETLTELRDPDNIDLQATKEAILNYPEIVGIKLRASKSVMGDDMETPFHKGRLLAEQHDLPIMVHIGNAPPTLDDVLAHLKPRDILTHCFHGKPSGIIENNQIRPSVVKSRSEGLYFDIGHGQASFSFLVYQQAHACGCDFDSISSDVHSDSIKGIHGLSHIMDKMVALGLSIDEVVDKVTAQPAKLMRLNQFGHVQAGNASDFTFFTMESTHQEVQDANHHPLTITTYFNPVKVIVEGKERDVDYEKYV